MAGELLVSEYRIPARGERRDPTAATNPTGYQSPGQPMVPVWDAWQAFQYGYLANTFVFACVKAIAEDIARLPIRVGDPTTGEYDVKHPLAVHLGPPPGGPNPATAARKLIAWSIVQRLVTGRIGWEIETGSSGRPLAYWPLPATHLKPIPTQGGTSYFAGFEYGRGTDPKRLPADRVFYAWDPAADDWRQPESRLQAMRLDVSVAVMQDRYDYAFLRNDSRPAAIVVHEAFAARDEREAFRRQFQARHAGPDNAGRVAFAEAEGGDAGIAGSLDVKVLGFSQKDSQAIQRYDSKLRAITVGLGVPLSRLGDASGRTFANADAEERFYWRDTVLPKVLDFGDDLTTQLLPRYSSTGGTVYFDTCGVEALQEVRNVAPIPAADLVSAGAVTLNQLRQLAGLDPVNEPGFDDYREPPAPPPPVVVQQPPALAAVPDPTADPAALDAGAASRRPFGVRAPIEGPGGDEVRATNLWRSADAQVTLLERTWQRELRTLFAKQERAVLARLRGKRGRQMLTRAGDLVPAGAYSGLGRELFDPAFWTASTRDILGGLFAQVFGVAGARVSDEFGISFDLLQEGADEQIQRRANQLAGQVTDTTYGQIQDQLADGIIAGDSIDVLADRVRTVFAEASERRATTIARTEVISSFNGAQVDAARQLPADVVGGMEWISTRDGRTRSAHRGSWPEGPDRQVVPIADAFLVGGEHLQYPGDPSGRASNVINCRCTVAFLDPDEFRKRYADQQDSGEVAPTAEGPPPAEPQPTAPDAGEYGPPLPDAPIPVAKVTARPERITRGNIVTTPSSSEGVTWLEGNSKADDRIAREIRAAQDAIGRVLSGIPGEIRRTWYKHGEPMQLRVGRLTARGADGSFSTDQAARARGISLKPSSKTLRSTFAHEFGHYLDFGDFGSPGKYRTATGEQQGVMDAINATASVGKLRELAKLRHGDWIDVADGKGFRHDAGYVSYLLDDRELWARAFSQYVAIKSGDERMLRELLGHVDTPTGGVMPYQWADLDEFAPVVRAFDDLFRAKGLLA